MLKAMFNEGEKGKARMEGGAHEKEVASSKFDTRKGGHTVSKQGLLNYGQDIVMAFSPPVVGCLVKKGFQEGGSRASQDPLATPLTSIQKSNEDMILALAGQFK